MFCGKCGKEMDNNAKFCPHCGAGNPNAAPVRTAEKTGDLPLTQTAPGKNLFKPCLVVLGALQALLFFVLSYGKLTTTGSVLKFAASFLGIDVPERLTALNAIRVMGGCAKAGVENAAEAHLALLFACGLPLVLGIVVLLINLAKGSQKTALLSIVLSAVTLLDYLLVKALLGTFTDLGYDLGGGFVFIILVSIVQLIVAIACRAAYKNNAQ